MKTLDNTCSTSTIKNVPDVRFYGNPDLWVLITKAWSPKENWMKSTKAIQTSNGVIVQVTTQQGDNIAESITFCPGVAIVDKDDGEKGLW